MSNRLFAVVAFAVALAIAAATANAATAKTRLLIARAALRV